MQTVTPRPNTTNTYANVKTDSGKPIVIEFNYDYDFLPVVYTEMGRIYTCLYFVYLVVRSVTWKRSCVRRWNRVSTTASAPTSIRARTGAIARSDIRDRRVTKVRIDRGGQFFIFVFLTWNCFRRGGVGHHSQFQRK